MQTPHESGPIERFMSEEHARIDRTLAESLLDGGSIDPTTYARFRHDLLRHIAMEEKVLLPYARSKRAGEPLPIAAQMRIDHGQIAKLLVPSPSAQLIDQLCQVLARHNALEEGPDALYATCDALAADEAVDVVERLRAQPQVPVAPHYDGPAHRRR
jgi:hypothetical protein